MEGNLVEEGPWRATRLWNSIVRSLHEGVPRKKHRKHLRTYEDCFTANEVIEWLLRQLKKNPNFDSDVSKEQTLMLLQKLLRAGVITKIDDDFSSSSSMLAKTPSAMLTGSNDVFKPGNDLYRLAPKVSFMYYVSTCILRTKLNLTTKIFTKTGFFLSKQNNLFFHITF